MFNKNDENNWYDNIKEAFREAKMVVVTIAFIVSSMVGGYSLVSEYFVTRLYADKLKQEFNTKLSELQQQTQSNKRILMEMRLIRMEEKLSREETLTPTEKRVYDKLKKDYDNMLNGL